MPRKKKSAAEASSPWYRDGLQFSCTQCGDCCSGAPGYVWVNAAEIAAMAARLETPVDEFEEIYVRKVGVRRSLKEYRDGDCVLLDRETRKCKVYADRPRQCRTWPFWDSNLATPRAWREACEACPGAGEGKLYSLEEVQAQASVVKI